MLLSGHQPLCHSAPFQQIMKDWKPTGQALHRGCVWIEFQCPHHLEKKADLDNCAAS